MGELNRRTLILGAAATPLATYAPAYAQTNAPWPVPVSSARAVMLIGTLTGGWSHSQVRETHAPGASGAVACTVHSTAASGALSMKLR